MTNNPNNKIIHLFDSKEDSQSDKISFATMNRFKMKSEDDLNIAKEMQLGYMRLLSNQKNK